MTTDQNTARGPENQGFSFKGCEEMMKMMMNRCMEGTGKMKDFEQCCGNMSDLFRDMMKKMDEQNKGKGE